MFFVSLFVGIVDVTVFVVLAVLVVTSVAV